MVNEGKYTSPMDPMGFDLLKGHKHINSIGPGLEESKLNINTYKRIQRRFIKTYQNL